jgi:simple sugar transport system ATP-binding protein
VISALELIDISKRFGDVTALDGASLRVRPGTVHAVLGENGAGKTTLMRVAYGLTLPDVGECRRNGVAYTARHPADAIALGIGMVQQHFSLVPAMTVAENVALGMHGTYRAKDAARAVRDVSAATGLHIDPAAAVYTLPVSAQQRVEILKALARQARVLILDEPTAVLAPQEADDLLRWVRVFASSPDRCAVLITHKLREARAIADDVTVLREGKSVLSRPSHEIDEATLVRAMIGGDVQQSTMPPRAATGHPVLSLRDVSVRSPDGRKVLRNVSLAIGAGELVGVAAVEGAGQDALLRVLAGRIAPSQGQVTLPRDVGFVPEDRHRDAVILDMSLTENFALRDLATRRGRMPWPLLRAQTQRMLDALDVRSEGPEAPMSSLSGGNQQKVVVGRELEPMPAALVAENPTRGLDIRATAAVHDRLRAARDAGAAVVVYSSDIDEVLELADRVLVVHAGEVSAAPLVREEIARAMLGAVLA